MPANLIAVETVVALSLQHKIQGQDRKIFNKRLRYTFPHLSGKNLQEKSTGIQFESNEEN